MLRVTLVKNLRNKNIKMIEAFLNPIDINQYHQISSLPKQIIGKNIKIYNKKEGLPDLKEFSIAIMGVFENRNSFFKMEKNDLNDFRNAFYSLYPGNWNINIIDLGNLENGESVEDTYSALNEIISSLQKFNVIPIILGGSHDLIYPAYRSFQSKKQLVNIVSVDRSYDFSQDEELISGRSYMSKIIMEQPNFLNNYTNIGYQNYYCAQEEKDLMDRLYFDSISLGDVLYDVKQVEPIFRDADIVGFDMKCLSWQANGEINSTPNGIDSRTICALSRYAGISDKVSFLGLFELGWSTSIFNQLLAQIVWYFIEGVQYRYNEFPINISEGFIKYNVRLSDREIIFYKSNKSQRWWMELINDNITNNKFKTSTLLPCTEQDYEEAMKDKIPERWFNAIKRLH